MIKAILLCATLACTCREGFSQVPAADATDPACKAVNKKDDERPYEVKIGNVFINGSGELLESEIDDDGCVTAAIVLPFDINQHTVTFSVVMKRSSETSTIVENIFPFVDFIPKFKPIVDSINCVDSCKDDNGYMLQVPTKACEEFNLKKFCLFPRLLPNKFDAGEYSTFIIVYNGDKSEEVGVEIQFTVI